MKTTNFLAVALTLGAATSWACSSASSTPSGAPPTSELEAGSEETPAEDSGAPVEVDSGLTGICASTFGDQLTEGFGRIDGVVYAVQKPSDKECTFPNNDHVVVQVLMGGAVYRLVTNVMSTRGDPDVRFAELDHALPEPAFEEGWHTGVALDYPTTLDAHNADFSPLPMNDLVDEIASVVKVGDKISIYGESGAGRPESAHNIHRSSKNEDGAIVVDPTGSPRFLLFHFSDQTF